MRKAPTAPITRPTLHTTMFDASTSVHSCMSVYRRIRGVLELADRCETSAPSPLRELFAELHGVGVVVVVESRLVAPEDDLVQGPGVGRDLL